MVVPGTVVPAYSKQVLGAFGLVGSFAGSWKWSGCTTLPGGQVVFAPYNARSILIAGPLARAARQGCSLVAVEHDPAFAEHDGPITRCLLVPVTPVEDGSWNQKIYDAFAGVLSWTTDEDPLQRAMCL